jgi:hypothetical protein
MVKRFTDTEIWNKDWFLELNMKQKLLTKFLFDACDCAGFYQISWFKLKIFFGEEVTKEDFEKLHFVKFLKEDFIYLENFILFQYKINSLEELNPSNNAHKGVIKRLKEFSPLLAPTQPLVSPFNGVIGRRKKEEGKNNSSNLEERKENLTKEKKEENDNVISCNFEEVNRVDPFVLADKVKEEYKTVIGEELFFNQCELDELFCLFIETPDFLDTLNGVLWKLKAIRELWKPPKPLGLGFCPSFGWLLKEKFKNYSNLRNGVYDAQIEQWRKEYRFKRGLEIARAIENEEREVLSG